MNEKASTKLGNENSLWSFPFWINHPRSEESFACTSGSESRDGLATCGSFLLGFSETNAARVRKFPPQGDGES